MLIIDPTQVLEHPWIREDGEASDKPIDSAVLSRMKQFRAMNKLKKLALKALLSLYFEESVSAKGTLELCINQKNIVLSSQLVPENASMENIGRAYHATKTFVPGLLYAKSQLRKLTGGRELSGNSERIKVLDDASSDACSSSVGSQSTDEPLEVLSQTEDVLNYIRAFWGLAHPKAVKLRNTSFPFYDELAEIWAKDRATGKDAETRLMLWKSWKEMRQT